MSYGEPDKAQAPDPGGNPASGVDLTGLLHAAGQGDKAASDALLNAVYEQLRNMAGAVFGGNAGHVLQPTALVNEVWIKLERHLDRAEDRQHFLRIAARAMRQVLSNYAAAARANKRRGPHLVMTTLSGIEEPTPEAEAMDVLALEDALTELGQLNERHARVVELRFLCSLTIAETAEALGVSHGTVETDWIMARSWLRRRLRSA